MISACEGGLNIYQTKSMNQFCLFFFFKRPNPLEDDKHRERPSKSIYCPFLGCLFEGHVFVSDK